jgi:hypothetical protein
MVSKPYILLWSYGKFRSCFPITTGVPSITQQKLNYQAISYVIKPREIFQMEFFIPGPVPENLPLQDWPALATKFAGATKFPAAGGTI